MFQASGGIQIDPAWAIATVTSLLGIAGSVIALLYRAQVAALQDQINYLKDESKTKDERTQRMIDQLNRVADVQDRGLTIVEAERRRR